MLLDEGHLNPVHKRGQQVKGNHYEGHDDRMKEYVHVVQVGAVFKLHSLFWTTQHVISRVGTEDETPGTMLEEVLDTGCVNAEKLAQQELTCGKEAGPEPPWWMDWMEVKVEVGAQVGADAAAKPTTESDPIQSWPNKPPEAKHVLPQQFPSPKQQPEMAGPGSKRPKLAHSRNTCRSE